MAGELRKCNGCGYQTRDKLRQCPECGAALLSENNIKRLGWAAVVIGVFLMLMMSILTLELAPTLLQPGKLIDGGRFTGSAELGRLVLMLFGAVGLFGVLASATGVYQIRTGQRNKWLLRCVIGVLVIVGGLLFTVMRAT